MYDLGLIQYAPYGYQNAKKEAVVRKVVSILFAFFCSISFLTNSFASITLRIMAINPSEEMEQSVPIKVYLPVEVKPEHVINKADLDIAYDTQQGSYYMFGEYTLKPSETLEKEIELKDIWIIEQTEIEALRREAKETLSGFEKTAYADKSAALYKGIDGKLKEIEDVQARSLAANPDQHISNYRYCATLLKSVKSDLVMAKTMLAEAKPQGLAKLTWKIIIFIIVFLGVLGFGFYIIWQTQANLEADKKEKAAPPKPPEAA